MSKKKAAELRSGAKDQYFDLPQKQSVPEWSEETTSIHPEDFWDSPQFFLSFDSKTWAVPPKAQDSKFSMTGRTSEK